MNLSPHVPGARQSHVIASGSQQSLPLQGGVVAGETVGVSLVQPLGIPRQTAIPRCLHVVDNGVDERVEPLDFTAMSPGVTWQPEGPVVGHPTRMRPRSNEAA